MPYAESTPLSLKPAERVEYDQVQLLDWTARILVVATEILTLEEPQEIARKVKDALVQELDFPVVSILLADATGTLTYVADHGVSDEVKALGFRPGGTA